MQTDQVPQDRVSTYARNRKAIYAVDDSGHYRIVPSSGWVVEEEVTQQAIKEFQRRAEEAYAAVLAGTASPLLYHMYARRMDLRVLAESTGMCKWRIRRHFRPAIFRKLSATVLHRYAEALGLEVAALKVLPPQERPDV